MLYTTNGRARERHKLLYALLLRSGVKEKGKGRGIVAYVRDMEPFLSGVCKVCTNRRKYVLHKIKTTEL